MKSREVLEKLDGLFPNPKCELNYSKDYELLIAVVLSAQTTDKRVNLVTEELFSKYDIFSLAKEDYGVIENIIRPVGTGSKKSKFIVDIAKSLVRDFNGNVPNDREYLEGLPGVGRKTCNVVLSNLFEEPALAVDTHVKRVSNRLELVDSDDVLEIEKELMNFFPKNSWSKVHHQLVLFGRYICKSKKPECDKCPFQCKTKK